MKDATVRLFRAVPVESKKTGKATKELLAKTISEGFIFSPEVIGNYPRGELETLFELTKKEVGLNSKQANSTFHKSWQKIKDASIEQLVVEQLIHYLTTYDLEEMGLYNEDFVYIPNEVLEIPNLEMDKVQLTVIKGLTKEELKAKLLALLYSGVALATDTIEDVVNVALGVGLTKEEIEKVRNREVLAVLYDYLDIIPENPVEFLRYAVYKATEQSLLIKNEDLILKIGAGKNLNILNLFLKYKQQYGLERLAEIFYRFKPLFLAFRTNPQLKTITNKIRKLAVKNHKPMPEDYLNTVTARLSRGEAIVKTDMETALEKANIFRKIRLAYALKFRTNDVDSILYKIRSGKGYTTEFKFTNKAGATEALEIVTNSIIEDISKNVKGKKIYIPEQMIYALPATEKQFTGMFPSGTCIRIPKDLVFGVHWENTDGHRIDLDLSLLSVSEKYGWDASYRDEGRSILFSGDVTTAPKPNGASELFYVQKQERNALLMVANFYNFEEKVDVPIKIFVAHEEVSRMKENYMVDPNNIVAQAESKINQKQKIVGLIITSPEESRFYFSEIAMGNNISSSNSEFAQNVRKYLYTFYSNTISLNEVLQKAGAELVADNSNCDIDLSPANLSKDTIFNLLNYEN